MKRMACWAGILASLGLTAAATTFDFVVETTKADEAFTFRIDNAADVTIVWGDGATESGLAGTANRTHLFAAAGRYTNRVSGSATRIAFGGATGTTPLLLRDIVSRLSDGVTGITSAYQMFHSAANITRFSQADWFDAASSNVTTLAQMFRGATAFDQNISGWNVGKVTTMADLFYNAAAFNQPIGTWTVSNVTTLAATFYGAAAFNQPIGDWDVGKVTTMASLFYNAAAFNQPIGDWAVSNVTTMSHTFYGAAAFSQPIGDWDVSNVTTMSHTFYGATAFDQPIGNWNVGK
ncbi:MAG: DUF285 domain-containing protein, partial [Lentisphaerae bacterium]|nr:DUF285 domain-containing protein [Lentisphaerota bacterium]